MRISTLLPPSVESAPMYRCANAAACRVTPSKCPPFDPVFRHFQSGRP